MKESSYNFSLYDSGYGYWYNALSGSYFRLSEEVSRKLSGLLGTPDEIKEVSETLFDKLANGGFLVSDDADELQIIRQKHHDAVHSKNYFLIVLPTLNCNFKCWYCIQDHVPSKMSQKTFDAIKRHIEYMIAERKIESLHLDWFGGEPFMYFDQVIKPLSEFAIAKCNEYSIPFINGSTTNGYFIDERIADTLTDLRFTQFQITLDGDKEYHNKVKYMNGCDSAFDHVLTNIDRFLTKNPGIQMFLRINYTHDTLSSNIVDDVNKHIRVENRNRVVITPKKVWQENVDKNFTDVIVDILDKFSESGYRVSRRDICRTFTPCYVNMEYYNAINFNGHVVKCTACDDLYLKQPKGILLDNGHIRWNDDYDKKCIEPTFENDKCLSCKQLPTCMGLCPRDHIAGMTHCKNDAMDETFEKSLLNFLINEYK